MPRKKPVKKGFFALKLAEVRHSAGLTQATLADRSGVPSTTIRQLEAGRREPTYGTLIKLAWGLGMSLAVFDQEPPARKRKT
jgi:transcriptional regulator with XRE-family HTH domain